MRIAKAAEAMLNETILPFWMKLRDDEFGGYYGYLDFDLNLDKKAPKGCILNSRILWFFSSAALCTGRAELAAEADHAFDFLERYCLDREHGGIYWSMTFDGKPLDTTKHTYNQAFAIYALAAYYRLSGNRRALTLAEELFDIVERHCTDSFGYCEAFTVDWQPEANEKLSENGVLAAKTMNTLLHVFEGYSGLYAVAPEPRLEMALRRILAIYTAKVYNPQKHRQEVFFDESYHSILDLHSYGHDIESSWLMDWGCGLLGDKALLKQVSDIDSELADEIYRTAYQKNSLCNECDRGNVNTSRIWWVQAEAVLGFVNAWQKKPDCVEYRDAAANIWHFIREKMVDPRPGSEWFWEVDQTGVPASRKPIVEPWKCPYHNGRLCIELMRRNPDVEI